MNKREAKRMARIYAAEIIRAAVASGTVEGIEDIPDEDKMRVYDAFEEIIASLEDAQPPTERPTSWTFEEAVKYLSTQNTQLGDALCSGDQSIYEKSMNVYSALTQFEHKDTKDTRAKIIAVAQAWKSRNHR